MKVYVAMSQGGDWSNDDHAEPGPAGVYSSEQKAKNAIKEMMLAESKTFFESNFDEDDERPEFEEMTFEEIEDWWSEQLDTEPYTIFEREIDSECITVTEADNESFD